MKISKTGQKSTISDCLPVLIAWLMHVSALKSFQRW